MQSALTSKGQATIPKAVRDHLGIAAGDRIKFFIQPDGRVVLLPVRSVVHLKGILPAPNRAVTIEEMNEGIGAAAAGEPDRRP